VDLTTYLDHPWFLRICLSPHRCQFLHFCSGRRQPVRMRLPRLSYWRWTANTLIFQVMLVITRQQVQHCVIDPGNKFTFQ